MFNTFDSLIVWKRWSAHRFSPCRVLRLSAAVSARPPSPLRLAATEALYGRNGILYEAPHIADVNSDMLQLVRIRCPP
jgi:hypothetical protein